MRAKKILVTGGAGYIGSHTAVELVRAGYEPVILDNFSNSERFIVARVRKITGRNVPLHTGNCARVLPYRELKLADDGEIMVKGAVLFQGYACASGMEKPFDADGWFATGDTGELDADGRLRVKGRKDNMFFRGGENIQPEEVEAWLLKVPGVAAALVAGKPDEEFGSVPVALIRCVRGAEVSRALLAAHLCRSLPKFKVPADFFRWPQAEGPEPLKVDRPRWAGVLVSGEGLERIA